MASKVKPVDIEDTVHSHLKLALKATCKSLGDDYSETYDIEKSQKNQFYRNVSIHETEQEFQCLIFNYIPFMCRPRSESANQVL